MTVELNNGDSPCDWHRSQVAISSENYFLGVSGQTTELILRNPVQGLAFLCRVFLCANSIFTEILLLLYFHELFVAFVQPDANRGLRSLIQVRHWYLTWEQVSGQSEVSAHQFPMDIRSTNPEKRVNHFTAYQIAVTCQENCKLFL